MGKNRVHLTFTAAELAFFTKRAKGRKKPMSASLQIDIANALIDFETGEGLCEGDKTRTDMCFDIQPRLWKILVCVSGRLGLKPGELVYRAVIAPHLIDILKYSLEAEDLATI